MSKKHAQPDEMRMSKDAFEDMMRSALGAPPPDAAPVKQPKKKQGKRKDTQVDN